MKQLLIALLSVVWVNAACASVQHNFDPELHKWQQPEMTVVTMVLCPSVREANRFYSSGLSRAEGQFVGTYSQITLLFNNCFQKSVTIAVGVWIYCSQTIDERCSLIPMHISGATYFGVILPQLTRP